MTKPRSTGISSASLGEGSGGAGKVWTVQVCLALVASWLPGGLLEQALAQAPPQPGRAGSAHRAEPDSLSRSLVSLLPPETEAIDTVSYDVIPATGSPLANQAPAVPLQDWNDGAGPTLAAADNDCVICQYSFQLLPDGLLYKSYLAGEKEPRISSVWLYEKNRGWVWETTLGGRVGLLRYGTEGAVNPQGWQFDLEGAAFPRIDPVVRSEMDSVDFRAGMLATWRSGPTAIKCGYYHISSHIADEYMLTHPTYHRIEYVRDSFILGLRQNLNDDLAIYGEVGYAFGHQGGAKPLEFQFGFEYSPAIANGLWGSPFAAVNGHLREDFNFSGSLNAEAGWQWRGAVSNRLLRAGFQYYYGKSLQYQFFDKHEELLGLGLWFDY